MKLATRMSDSPSLFNGFATGILEEGRKEIPSPKPTMRIQFNPVWPWPIVLVVAVGLVAFSFWTYRPGTPARRLLLSLRLAALRSPSSAMLAHLVFSKTHKQSSVLVFLLDASRSMQLRDMWAGQSRYEAFEKVFGEARSDITELEQTVRIRRF